MAFEVLQRIFIQYERRDSFLRRTCIILSFLLNARQQFVTGQW